jgi:hypothetical protein
MSSCDSIAFRIARRRIIGREKDSICSDQNNQCAVCQNQLEMTVNIDHIIPLQAGGLNVRTNLHALCPNCHARKTRLEPRKIQMIKSWNQSRYRSFRFCWKCGNIFSSYFRKHSCTDRFWFAETCYKPKLK